MVEELLLRENRRGEWKLPVGSCVVFYVPQSRPALRPLFRARKSAHRWHQVFRQLREERTAADPASVSLAECLLQSATGTGERHGRGVNLAAQAGKRLACNNALR